MLRVRSGLSEWVCHVVDPRIGRMIVLFTSRSSAHGSDPACRRRLVVAAVLRRLMVHHLLLLIIAALNTSSCIADMISTAMDMTLIGCLGRRHPTEPARIELFTLVLFL